MSARSSFYKEKIENYRTQIQISKKRVNLIALLRMIMFVVLCIATYLYITNSQLAYILAAIIFFIAFIILVRISFRLRDQKLLQEKMLFINENELSIIENKPNQFDNGQSFQIQENYVDDLDIFGHGSLFHLLNRTTTSHGREKLAATLKQPFNNKDDIESYQHAVKILSEENEKGQLLTANGLLHEEQEGNLYSVTAWLNTDNRLNKKKWLLAVRLLVSSYNIFAIYYLLLTANYFPIVIGIVASSFIISLFGRYISEQHQMISKKQKVLDQYTAILETFSTLDTRSSEQLKQIQATCLQAHRAIRKLAKLSQLFDQRLNFLVDLFLNRLFLFDINIMIALENWKNQNKNQFPAWVDCVGSIEYLNSIAIFTFNNPSYKNPLISAEKIFIEAKQIAHPLIPAQERITNDFVIGKNEKLQLITGSNMSGKTTFLRTIGINLLLAQCGAPVCGASFEFTPMRLLSAIRVNDSLQEHTSYFMAELKRLQQIILQLQTGSPGLVLIDEILKGTNSEDKTYGSEQFIRKILQYNCLTLFATHDLSLSKLDKELPSKINNYCFESIINNGELYFDYQLKKGVAKNRNASFLMEKMKII